MVGMTIPGGSLSSDYCSRTVIIQVTGMANPMISRHSNYQVKVPFSQMSATLRQITSQGGKIEKVVVVGADSAKPVQPVVSQQPRMPKAVDVNQDSKRVVSSQKKTTSKKTKPSQASSRKGRRRSKKTS